MYGHKEITLKWRDYLIGETIETLSYSILLLFILSFDLSLWIFILSIIVPLWILLIYEYFHKESDVTIAASGIVIDNICIKWKNIDTVKINTIKGSAGRELVIVKRNGDSHSFRYFPTFSQKSSLMIDHLIRESSGNSVQPKACLWVRYFDYPICKCYTSLFRKGTK